MNVSLTPELEQFVSAKVETGRYNSASEVVRKHYGFWRSTIRPEHLSLRASIGNWATDWRHSTVVSMWIRKKRAPGLKASRKSAGRSADDNCAKHGVAIYALLFGSCPRSCSMRSRQIVSPMPLAMPNPVIVAHRAAGSFILSVANMPTIRLAM